eukprot:86610-Rhodomonas_salina.6
MHAAPVHRNSSVSTAQHSTRIGRYQHTEGEYSDFVPGASHGALLGPASAAPVAPYAVVPYPQSVPRIS